MSVSAVLFFLWFVRQHSVSPHHSAVFRTSRTARTCQMPDSRAGPRTAPQQNSPSRCSAEQNSLGSCQTEPDTNAQLRALGARKRPEEIYIISERKADREAVQLGPLITKTRAGRRSGGPGPLLWISLLGRFPHVTVELRFAAKTKQICHYQQVF